MAQPAAQAKSSTPDIKTSDPSNMSAPSTSAASAPPVDMLNIQVKTQDGSEVWFKVKRTTAFRKVFVAFCNKMGADLASCRFLFDGQRVEPDATPASLDMTDLDVIDCMQTQTGGSTEQ